MPGSFPRHYAGYAALGVWALLTLLVLSHLPFGLDEGGAKALVLDWSIGDQVANSVVTLGAPDVRALLWLPLGYLWPGQVFAAKVFLIAVLAASAYGLYRWRNLQASDEVSLLATGLLLIAPLTLQQLDALAPGVVLLALFVAGFWLDRAYRQTPRIFGGLFFAQLLVCAFSVSVHPAGLAYPLALFWSWRTQPLDTTRQRHFYVGIAVLTLLALLLSRGWPDLGGWRNPITQLPALFWGEDVLATEVEVQTWVQGLILAAALGVLLVARRSALWSDLGGRTLWLGVLLGVTESDGTWLFLTLVLFLYEGFAWLLQPRALWAGRGFMAQRGWLLVLLLLMGTVSLRLDRQWFDQNRNLIFSQRDLLIKTFADDVERLRRVADDAGKPMPRLRVASQWPARTMIACRCDALPLPPVAKDPGTQKALLRGLTHLLLLPSATQNLGLTQNLALLGSDLETVTLQPGGVILAVTRPDLAPALPQPALDQPPPPQSEAPVPGSSSTQAPVVPVPPVSPAPSASSGASSSTPGGAKP